MLAKYMRWTSIALLICLFFIVAMGTSDAISITQMYPSYGGNLTPSGNYENRTGYLYHTAYVQTDVPYYSVDWYINGVAQSGSTGGGGATEAWFSPNPSSFPGSSSGITYTIRAVAWDADNTNSSTERSYDVVVYTPCRETAASLTASITSYGWSGTTASAEAEASVEHTGGADAPSVTYRIIFRFWVVKLDRFGNVAQDGRVFVADIAPISGGLSSGDTRVTRSNTTTYTLAGGWDPGDRFQMTARVSAGAENNTRNAVAKTCSDEASADIILTNQ